MELSGFSCLARKELKLSVGLLEAGAVAGIYTVSVSGAGKVVAKQGVVVW